MSMQRVYSRNHMSIGRLATTALAFGGLLAAAACASGGAASGTYHPAPVGSGASYPGEPGGVHINVSLGERRLYLKNGSNVVEAYTIGVGKPGYETPVG